MLKKALKIIFALLILSGVVYYVIPMTYLYITRPPIQTENSDPSRHLVVIGGDSRDGNHIHPKIVDAIIKERPALFFHLGDLVRHGSKPYLWIIFMWMEKPLIADTEYRTMRGNHETMGFIMRMLFREPYASKDGMYYTISRDEIKYIILDSEVDYSEQSEQFKWFQQQLIEYKSNDAEKAVIIFVHVPMIGQGKQYKLNAPHIEKLIQEYQVNLVMSGHNHTYERCEDNGTKYITTGGLGSPLYDKTQEDSRCSLYIKTYHYTVMEKTAEKLIFTIKDDNMTVIDTFDVDFNK